MLSGKPTVGNAMATAGATIAVAGDSHDTPTIVMHA
jgi:hypothetical protein